jgi:hypothetical protein
MATGEFGSISSIARLTVAVQQKNKNAMDSTDFESALSV